MSDPLAALAVLMTMRRSGYLALHLGPMFSSKTLSIIKQITESADTNYRALYINYHGDTRTDTEGGDMSNFTSHSSSIKNMSDKIDKMRVDLLSEIPDDVIRSYHVIGVDEGGFYEDIDTTVKRWVNELHCHVYVGALDGNFKRKHFGNVVNLIPEADEYTKHRAQCSDCIKQLKDLGYDGPVKGLDAPFSARVSAEVRGPPQMDHQESLGGLSQYPVQAQDTQMDHPQETRLSLSTEEKKVGGKDDYKPVCRYHHNLSLS
jgi:thymidine kinase